MAKGSVLSQQKNLKLDFGNSGTLARLIMGLLSTTPRIKLNLTGDHSLRKRNMKKIIMLMSEFGASFEPKKFNFPIKITSSEMPIGINYKAGVSAQLKSAVILAGLNSYGTTKILEQEQSRDHTEKMLSHNKDVIKIVKKKNKIIEISGKKKLKNIKVNVFGDPSSAAFFCALTLLKKRSKLKISNVGLNPTRTGFYHLLKKHGAKIQFRNLKKNNGKIYGDIYIESSKLKPIKASKKYYVNSTDEYPILFVIAALTKGVSIFKGIKDLANKESNRITEMQKTLSQIGIKTKSTKNELKIFGTELINTDNKITIPNLVIIVYVSSFILAILTGVRTNIKNFETVYTSSPSFLKIMKSLGANFEIQK